jgi:mannose-1-phosphate guanylyltransferase/mannose-6-phosphate isomerase
MLVPVILSGGSGTRLWPVSREASPKPFIKLADGQSLLQKTFLRACNLPHAAEILTITNREYYFRTKDDYAALVVLGNASSSLTFLLEPMGRNTAPAVALGALKLSAQHGLDAVMVVLAADHVIENQEAFTRAIERAVPLAEQGYLVTFGVPPSSPDTGYGYIECGEPCDSEDSRLVKCFTEKPSLELARAYLENGNYLWNSGTFCFKAGVILEALKTHASAVYEGAVKCWEATQARAVRDGMLEIEAESFAHIPDISIDYAVMEKVANGVVVRGDFGWSDIGSWNTISNLTRPDEAGNSVIGEAVLVDVANSFIQSESRLIAAVGVKNLVIVDTQDALLVADRDRSQDVKQVVERLKLMKHEAYKLHRTVSRPWGTYTVLEESERFKIKRIVVKPGRALSLQMHYHRSEHWVVVQGTAKVTNGEKVFLVNSNESTYIPAGHKHRLENPGMLELVMIEVQSGDYVGEDDIVRFDDRYGRS